MEDHDDDGSCEEVRDTTNSSPSSLPELPGEGLVGMTEALEDKLEYLEALDDELETTHCDKLSSSALTVGTYTGTHSSALCFQEEGLVCTAKYDLPRPKHTYLTQLPLPKAGVCHINNLPCELLLNIFSYFRVDELFSCIAPVCVQWRQLVQDPTLRKKLVFSFQRKISGERGLQLLKESPYLVTLEMQSREDGGNLLHEVANSCPRLRHATAKMCDGVDKLVIQALANNCPDVRTLNLEGSLIHCADYPEIAGFKHLRHLNISHCHFLDDLGLIAIAKNCCQLEYLDIDGINNIHDQAVVFVIQNLCNSLKCLFLDGETLTDVSYRSLVACRRLQKLGISFCEQMTDIGLAGITGLSELSWLKLRKGVQLSADGLVKMFSSGHMSNLTHLNLGECSMMNDEALHTIARACPLLTNIVLHWCWDVTDAGIFYLVSLCPHLRVLDLVGLVQLTGTSLVDLANQLPHLLVLDLEQCNTLDDAVLQHLAVEHPNLQILDYWGEPVIPQSPEEADEDDAFSNITTNELLKPKNGIVSKE